MNGLVLLGAALPVGATYLLLQPARAAGLSRVCAIALAIGVGLGIASCTFFLALLLFDGQLAGVIGVDAILMACALVVWRRSGTYPAVRPTPLSSTELVLGVAVLIAAATGAVSFLANTLEDPHGRWDAWATWNVRARWLADTGPVWREAFARPTIHGDYPLLLPATVARLWVYAGANSPVVPAGVAAAYGMALVLLLYGVVAALRGRSQALVGALCLLGTPVFLRIVPWQYADVPLAFYLLAAVALLSLADHDPARGWVMSLWAGVAAGLAAWTKNEGMVLALGIVIVRAALLIVRRAPAPARRSAAWFFAGLLPPAAILLYFKIALAPQSPVFRQKAQTMIEQLLDLGRYEAILRAAGSELVSGTSTVLFALVLYAILLGRTRDLRARSQAAGVACILGFAALAYGFTYLTARAELTWILSHSMDRLILQLWPSALLAALLYLSSPTERAPAPSRASAGRPPAKPPSRRQRRASRR